MPQVLLKVRPLGRLAPLEAVTFRDEDRTITVFDPTVPARRRVELLLEQLDDEELERLIGVYADGPPGLSLCPSCLTTSRRAM